MSNKKSSKTKATQTKVALNSVVPDQFKSTIKVSEDEQTTFLTHSMPRYFECVVREKIMGKPAKVSATIDTARIFGSTRLRAIFERGLKKQLIDGARSSEQVKEGDAVVTRKFSFEEAHADAVATLERNIEWLYGQRDKQDYVSSADPVVSSCVDALSVWVVKNCQTDTGERYTKSKLPKVLKGVSTLEEFKQIAEQFGATKKRTERIIFNAKAIHADDDDEIELAE